MRRFLLYALATLSSVSASGVAQAQVMSPAQPTSASVQTLQERLARDEKTLQDWANLNRYRKDNSLLASTTDGANTVVFMGDSITDAWGRGRGSFFPEKKYLNRGISGQTTPQMLIRFRPDVIALKPKVVVILAGTNDLAGNTGPMTIEEIEGNLQSMAELAKVSGIRVVMSSVTPVCDVYQRQTTKRPPAKIITLNGWIKEYTAQNHLTYLDYYSAMVDDQNMLRKELTYDGLHPNDAGYEVMSPIAERAIETALSSQ